MTRSTLDRRAAQKAERRSTIVDAARDLIEERGGPTFGVDELAARADVSRRTVFNHFPSLDDLFLTVCEDALAVVVDDFLARIARTPLGDGGRSAMFDEIAAAMHDADLPAAIATILRILGGPSPADERKAPLTDAAFSRVTERLLAEVLRRHPAADVLEAELLVESLMGGIVVISRHWVERTGGRLDAAARATWQDLLARLIANVRNGYLPAAP
ncbi:TetR/AcrR family transcriptional regulator [Tersicoccus phoenicis]|uniref:TetR/AcrR family transcriptional regulator n=1 Tax=Tersicoccus phoenicis TaxID=554083 RepID=UPI001356667C|nr:TetR/AcrR family transcriptional regulator [Tersicoccus phoenicis]